MADTVRMTAPRFRRRKGRGERLTMLTAYDFPTARLLDQAGVDSILVGDSLAMVIQGRPHTLGATVDQLIYHGEMVCRAAERALVVVDLPFPINHLAPSDTIQTAGRILKETGCQAVKLEGGAEQASNIAALATAGIPVMAHVGLRPQAIHAMGGYRVQRDEPRLLADAQAAEQAGAFSLVVECVPPPLAAKITAAVKIPTIGIGSGADCDGQVLVLHDLLGMTSGYTPSFARQYAQLGEAIGKAVQDYCNDVREGKFPGPEHEFQ